MALIKHFSLIQLILLLSIERFLSLSLSLCKLLFSLCKTRPSWCLPHISMLVLCGSQPHGCTVWFHISGCPPRAFCCWLPNSCPGKVSSCPRSSSPGPLCPLVWTFLPESSIWKMLHQCSKQADMMRASGWLLIPYLNLKLCLEVGFCVKTSIVIWVLCCVIVHKVKPAGVKS